VPHAIIILYFFAMRAPLCRVRDGAMRHADLASLFCYISDVFFATFSFTPRERHCFEKMRVMRARVFKAAVRGVTPAAR